MKKIIFMAVAFLMATGSVFAQQAGTVQVEGTTATVKGQGIYCGDVEMQVTQAADGTYYLYDNERQVSVLIAATLPSLDSLAAKDLLFSSIYVPNVSTDDVETYINAIMNKIEKDINVSNYLKLADIGNSKGEFHDYRLKGISITQMKTADGQEYTSPTQSVSFRVALFHAKNRWATLYDSNPELTGSSIDISGDELYDRWATIPVDGATLMVDILPYDDGSNRRSSHEETKLAHFQANFVPNENGVTEIDADGLKATITYERSASPLVDAYTTLVSTYEYYKNTFGRQGYDGQNTPLSALFYLPGSEMGLPLILDDPTPRFVYTVTQAGAYAFSDYNPYVILCGTGGRTLENGEFIQMRPMIERSLICHEFTHLVTKTSAKLSSGLKSEGGALNESFSDIMAISMMKTSEYGYGPDTPWIVGGKGHVVGKSNLRNMADPKKSLDGLFPQPDTYEGQYWENPEKYCRMGVQNKFYYLLCEGGKGTNDKKVDYDVTGIGIEKGVQIAYLTLTKYCSPQSDFSNIRESWLKAAQELYGENSTEAQTVAKAWTAVGIEGMSPSGINTITISSGSDYWYTLDGRKLADKPATKGVYIHRGHKVVNR